MRQEVARCSSALDLALSGSNVALVSGGDAGVYGMAGLVLEMMSARQLQLSVEVIPGISAVNAAAALLGAPLMSDYVALSLSDQLTPLDEIVGRLKAVAQTDLVVALFNPKGSRRTEPYARACQILLECRAPTTPVGIVRAGYRPEQRVVLTTLECMADAEVDMLSLVIVGSSLTYVCDGRMITPRGYADRYELATPGSGRENA